MRCVEPIPPLRDECRGGAPLEAHEASYLAASAKIFSLRFRIGPRHARHFRQLRLSPA
jgi:hypothetical protein